MQDEFVRLAFATRCALRAMPGLGGVSKLHDHDVSILELFRILLSNCVIAQLSSSKELTFANATSQEEAFANVLSKYDGGTAALSSALSVTAAFTAIELRNSTSFSEDAFALMMDSAELISRGGDVSMVSDATSFDTSSEIADSAEKMLSSRLWHDQQMPPYYASVYQNLLEYWKRDRAVWGFWERWYVSVLSGNPIDWELQRKIAQIDPKIWAAGPAEVAKKISEIERLHKTSVSPSLQQTADGLWDVEESPAVPDEPLNFAVSSVEQSLDIALKLCSQNMFNEDSDEAQVIRRALEKHRSNPSMLAVSFWQACMSFQANLGTEYPKDDPNLVGLQNTLYTSIEEMCEHSELIKKRIGRLAALTPKQELTEEDKADLRALPDETKDHLTEKAQEELVDAVEDVSGSQKPQRSLQARLANWVTTLGKGLDQGQKNEKRAKWLVDLGRRLMRVFFPGDDDDEGGDDTE